MIDIWNEFELLSLGGCEVCDHKIVSRFIPIVLDVKHEIAKRTLNVERALWELVSRHEVLRHPKGF